MDVSSPSRVTTIQAKAPPTPTIIKDAMNISDQMDEEEEEEEEEEDDDDDDDDDPKRVPVPSPL
ncbi:hypothetical protein MMC22_008498 [Lobaria immixta]|nr:hypothetical protein [Lobaria immixta]